jgi:hypothetical protein
VEDISLHILDIAENSVRADATKIEIIIVRDRENDILRVEVTDNGRGMDPETLARARDPFFTTKKKKTGLGIPLLAQAVERSGGALTIDSAPGRGTRISATFRWGHVDRPAIGNITDTLLTLIAGHPDIDVAYEEREGDRVFRFDARELKCELEDVPINTPEVLDTIRGILQKQAKFGSKSQISDEVN